jgi:hypothetical protein
MGLVHQLDLDDMPAIYIFYCACCQLAETEARCFEAVSDPRDRGRIGTEMNGVEIRLLLGKENPKGAAMRIVIPIWLNRSLPSNY